MPRLAHPVCLFALTLAVAASDSACSSTSQPPAGPTDAGGGPEAAPDATTPPDASADTSVVDADAHADSGQDAGPACPAPTGLGRGLTWVRENPMMISALSVVMGNASTSAVSDYFDVFHANTVHLWQTGLPAEVASWSAAGHAGFRYVSWVDAAGNSSANGKLLGGAAALPGRIGYQISDEPEDQASLNAIAQGAAAVKATDPAGLRIINLSDSSAANALRTQAAGLADFDVLSYDHYTMGHDAYSGLMSTRTAALAAAKPYWRYMRSFYYKGDSPEGAPADFLWDALVGAVFGFTGYTWFVYSIEAGSQTLAPLLFSVGGDYSAPKTARYGEVAAVNEELARLGHALVMLKSTDVRYVKWLANLSGLSDWSAGAGGDPYLAKVSLGGTTELLVGLFRDDCNEPYVMLQSQAHPMGDFPDNNDNDASFTLNFDFSKSTDPSLDETQVSVLDLTTGKVASRALTSTGAHTATLTVTLSAGDALLFKYTDASPFALQ